MIAGIPDAHLTLTVPKSCLITLRIAPFTHPGEQRISRPAEETGV
jgi:hypothetical protein